MTEEQIKSAVQRGYSKGYIAGRRKRRAEQVEKNRIRERQAFIDKAYIALLPIAMTVNNWKIDEKLVTSVDDRIELARRWVNEALKKRPLA